MERVESGSHVHAALINPIELLPTPNNKKVAGEKISQKKKQTKFLYTEMAPSSTKCRELSNSFSHLSAQVCDWYC